MIAPEIEIAPCGPYTSVTSPSGASTGNPRWDCEKRRSWSGPIDERKSGALCSSRFPGSMPASRPSSASCPEIHSSNAASIAASLSAGEPSQSTAFRVDSPYRVPSEWQYASRPQAVVSGELSPRHGSVHDTPVNGPSQGGAGPSLQGRIGVAVAASGGASFAASRPGRPSCGGAQHPVHEHTSAKPSGTASLTAAATRTP